MKISNVSTNISQLQKSILVDPEESFKQVDASHVKVDSQSSLKIQQEILEMRKWEAHVKSHELAHALVGGSHISSASYVYTYGPDGKKYISGGVVSVRIPKGLSQDSVDKLRQLKNATSASRDASERDLHTAAIISAEERSRTRMLQLKNAVKQYEKQLSQKSMEKIQSGDEIFHYKKMNFHSYRIMELFV